MNNVKLLISGFGLDTTVLRNEDLTSVQSVSTQTNQASDIDCNRCIGFKAKIKH